MLRITTVSLVCCFLLTSFFSTAQARSRQGAVERAYRGKVVILKKAPPMSFSNQGLWMRFLRVNKTVHIWPKDKKKGTWKFEFMAFFNRALNDLEVKIKFYDVTESKRFVAADTFYTPERGQSILSSNVVVEKPEFAPNRKYLMEVVSARGSLLSSTTFWLRGQEEVYSGRVTFSDDETR